MLKSSIKTERFHICISPCPFPPSPSFFMTCSFFLSITGRISVTDECVVSVWATERKSHPQANLLSNGKRCCLSPCVVASCFLPHSRGLVHLLFHPLPVCFLLPFTSWSSCVHHKQLCGGIICSLKHLCVSSFPHS